MAADQTEQADATSSTLRDMIQTMSSAQLLLRRWRGTAGDTGEPPNSSSSNGGSSTSSSKEDAAAAAELQRTLQPELYATKAKLSRALSALTKMQAAYQQQQASIKQLELQLQQYKEQQKQQAGEATDATAEGGAAGSNSEQAGMLSGLAAVLAMAAGAGAASSQMSGQQQELRSQLAAAEDIERQLNNELQAKQEQMQKLKLQVRCCLASCTLLISALTHLSCKDTKMQRCS
jgi:hypothetical protein